jgi:hypothetical protein
MPDGSTMSLDAPPRQAAQAGRGGAAHQYDLGLGTARAADDHLLPVRAAPCR